MNRFAILTTIERCRAKGWARSRTWARAMVLYGGHRDVRIESLICILLDEFYVREQPLASRR